MPIGMPGWPEFAASTASIDRNRMAFAMSECVTPDSVSIFFTAVTAMGGSPKLDGVHADLRLDHVVGDQELGERERMADLLSLLLVRVAADIGAQLLRL